MCLYTKQRCAKVSDKPIKCYKVLRVDTLGRVVTPYQEVEVQPTVIWGNALFRPENPLNINFFDNSDTQEIFPINEGFVHAYKDIDAAARVTYNWKSRIVIYECEIPAGTEYFEGTNRDICAHAIKFVKKIIDKDYREPLHFKVI